MYHKIHYAKFKMARSSSNPRVGQQELLFGKPPPARPKHGGARKGAGRRRSKAREGFEDHVARPRLDGRHPVHVSMRAKRGCPSLRVQGIFKRLRARIAAAPRDGFRVVHFSVQHNHVHLIVEADDRVRLWRGIQRLAQRMAWDVNAVTPRRHGSLWRDRYTRRDLTSLRQVRNALVYVLMNIRKHAITPEEVAVSSLTLDPRSSAAWLDGWDPRAGPWLEALANELDEDGFRERPISVPRTWSLRTGWKRHGLIRPNEAPKTDR
jgi:putative transposase